MFKKKQSNISEPPPEKTHYTKYYEHDGMLRRPVVPIECGANGHMYWILLPADVPRVSEALAAVSGVERVLTCAPGEGAVVVA